MLTVATKALVVELVEALVVLTVAAEAIGAAVLERG